MRVIMRPISRSAKAVWSCSRWRLCSVSVRLPNPTGPFMPGSGSRNVRRVCLPEGRNMYGPCGSSTCLRYSVGLPGLMAAKNRSRRARRPLWSRGRMSGRLRRAPLQYRGGQTEVASCEETIR